MTKNDVDLLRSLVEAYPGLRRLLRLDPPRTWFEGAWRSLDKWELGPGRVRLTIKGGPRIAIALCETAVHRRAQWRRCLLCSLLGVSPRWRAARLNAGTDRRRSRSDAFLRAELVSGRKRRLIAAALPEEPESAGRLLSEAILWWNHCEGSERDVLEIHFPEHWSGRLLHLMGYLRPQAAAIRYRRESSNRKRFRFRLVWPTPTRQSSVRTPYVFHRFLDQAPSAIRGIQERFPALDLIFRRDSWELSLLGFPVAVQGASDAVAMTSGEGPLSIPGSDSLIPIPERVQTIARLRRFPPPDPGAIEYRHAPERWMETLVLRSPGLIDRDMRGPTYLQVPTCLDGDRAVLDALSLTRDGRLAVIEFKAHKSLDLLFQGLDYWDRVRFHLGRGDFEKAGYFPGRRLSPQAPRLFLVSPLFEMHRLTRVLRAHLRLPEEVVWVGLNSDWRRGVKVLRRVRL